MYKYKFEYRLPTKRERERERERERTYQATKVDNCEVEVSGLILLKS